MKTISVPEKEQLSFGAQSILESVEKKMGKIPNLYATIGYSSSALKSMLETEASLAHDSSFTAKEREAINLIVSQVNECDYCLAAHTTLAKMRGFTEEDTLEIRKGGFSEAKLDAAIKLAHSIANNKGNAGNGALENFFNAGYDEKALIELTALVALRSFTNYVFANTQIPIDFPLAQAI
ncbi:MAG: alkylhydroperoxidase [Chryseobacterium sp.]|uniref:carboxymuconolactone decarboxylase family protein n=1 Tax=Chryseobacterium sp. TaxID=1871047 RepID=UPI000DB880D9|nr:carboxymuconolactone decarboxylase family protein [Chryseobacterium sp.]MPS66784.1 carboxymuconolactone decarboxylase family protein [Chryseobacterium sp.]PZU10614.1 MAG: alkylhydroperoxidase [Chryseobacterium sp.]